MSYYKQARKTGGVQREENRAMKNFDNVSMRNNRKKKTDKTSFLGQKKYVYMHAYKYLHPVIQLCLTLLLPHGLQPNRLLCPQNFPGKDTGMRCHFLLQRIFPIQGSNPCLLHLLHWQADSLALHNVGNPIYKYLFTYKYTIIYINKMYNYYVEG